MAQFVSPWLLVLLAAVLAGAVLDLTAEREVKGVWKASVNLLCTYEPSVFFKEQNVIWRQGGRTIFHRDPESGDQTLLIAFRGRISVSKETPGDASLQIQALEMSDSGLYSCEVTWEARNRTRLSKSASTRLRVEKVPVTKPELMPSHLGSALPRGARIHLSCSSHGSPPIQYRWFKEVPGGSPIVLAAKDVLAFGNLQASDEGTYYCEVENRAGATTVQRSDTIRLTVEGSIESSSNASVTQQPGSRKAALPLYVIILLAVLGGGLLVATISVTFCRRKTKTAQSYGVTYNNNAANFTSGEAPAAPSEIPGPIGCEYEDPASCIGNPYYPEPTKCNDYVAMGKKMDNEYEFLVNKMESEYEAIDTK